MRRSINVSSTRKACLHFGVGGKTGGATLFFSVQLRIHVGSDLSGHH